MTDRLELVWGWRALHWAIPEGSPPTANADAGFGCETRFLPPFPPSDEFQQQPTIPSTCSMFMIGTTADNSFLGPGTGTVTKVASSRARTRRR